jgi:sarcosine oxidase subunit beta
MLPQSADVVIIGGGVIGTSIAYHLARRGAGLVVLLERKQLAAGATGRSSGLVRMHYDNPLEAQMAFKSLETFQHFDEIVGGDAGFVRTGYMRIVQPRDLPQLRANVPMLQTLGINTRLIQSHEIREIAPYLDTGDVPIAAFEPDSGYADPHLTTMGLAEAARRYGARILQSVPATGIRLRAGRITGVVTSQGYIATPVVVNAAGPWGALVAAMAGVALDLTIIHHQVAIVETPAAVQWPHITLMDGVHHTYLRPESGRLTLIGGDHDDRTLSTDQLDSYSESLTPDTRDRILERLCARVPAMETGGVRRGHAGIYVNTPDRHALLGPVPEVPGFYCAVGFSGHGFKEAPIAGQAMSELILDGRASVMDITPLHPNRFREGRPYSGPYPYTQRSA